MAFVVGDKVKVRMDALGTHQGRHAKITRAAIVYGAAAGIEFDDEPNRTFSFFEHELEPLNSTSTPASSSTPYQYAAGDEVGYVGQHDKFRGLKGTIKSTFLGILMVEFPNETGLHCMTSKELCLIKSANVSPRYFERFNEPKNIEKKCTCGVNITYGVMPAEFHDTWCALKGNK